MASFLKLTTAVAIPQTMQSAGTQNAIITVKDMLGRQVFTNASRGQSAVFWDGKILYGVSFKQGVYFVQVRFGNSLQTQKFIIKK